MLVIELGFGTCVLCTIYLYVVYIQTPVRDKYYTHKQVGKKQMEMRQIPVSNANQEVKVYILLHVGWTRYFLKYLRNVERELTRQGRGRAWMEFSIAK